jgi:hypothetical protein
MQSCTNYRGVKLMSHTMKLLERVIAHRLSRVTNITENQFGFMPRRSTINYEGDFLGKTTYGEKQGTKETLT